MPKRDRDAEDDQSSTDVVVKKEDQETGSQGGDHHSDDMDLEHMKEMVKEGLEREAQLSSEKAEREAQWASEKAQLEKENRDLKEEATLQFVHRLFDMDTKGVMRDANFLPNPNLLNGVKSQTLTLERDICWMYVSANSWTEVLGYFENGIISPAPWTIAPDLKALASLVVCVKARGGPRVVVGAVTYRCSERFHHHLYKEKYKAETETLWREGYLGRCSENMALDGEIVVPASLHLAIGTLQFDGVLDAVFLPTNKSETAGAQYSINLDKMEAVELKSKKVVKVFETCTMCRRYHNNNKAQL